MKTEKINELIKALRCSASTAYGTVDCKGCAYRYLEEVDEKIPCPADVEVNGVKYWESCDCERMAMDAANILEKVLPAYEKQIPKKVVYHRHGYYLCPTCNHYICDKETAFSRDDTDFCYCDGCGQKLKWRDEE